MTFVVFSNIMVRSLQISARSRKFGEMEDISLQSRRDLECHERHGKISTISAQFRQSRRVLGKMEDILPQSCRDLESNKHHGEISGRSLQSRRDLGKNFAWVQPNFTGLAVLNFFAMPSLEES